MSPLLRVRFAVLAGALLCAAASTPAETPSRNCHDGNHRQGERTDRMRKRPHIGPRLDVAERLARHEIARLKDLNDNDRH